MSPSLSNANSKAHAPATHPGNRNSGHATRTPYPWQPRILVIGAGMSGILTVIKLREAGFSDITVFEKSDRPGGTWRDNTYPGLKCDVPAPMFTYSFEPNPEYSERFPQGGEIKDYLDRVFTKYKVQQHVCFNKSVCRITWNQGYWIVETNCGDIQHFNIVLCATGILHTPSIPKIPGQELFRGHSWHTNRWNHEVELSQKKVAIIGTGSTAVQLLPELLARGARVLLFQRTPQWIFPMPSRRYTDIDKKRLRDSTLRARGMRYLYSKAFQWTFARAVIGNPLLLGAIQWMCRNHIHRKVKDARLAAQLTPNYRAGCKRLIFNKGFYKAIQSPNAKLIVEEIERIEPCGIRIANGELHEVDVVIYATGFKAHNYMSPMEVIGKNGVSLSQAWGATPYAHRSTSIPGFPNMFMIFGPYSPIGNYSAISVAETQTSYIIQQLKMLVQSEYDSIESKLEVTRALTEQMDRAMRHTVWLSGCNSWYLNDNGSTQMWPWTFEKFERQLAKVHADEFHFVSELHSIRRKESKAHQQLASASTT